MRSEADEGAAPAPDGDGASRLSPSPRFDGGDSFARQMLGDFALVLAAILIAGSLTAIWGRYVVMDTDRWVAAVGPLADDPAMQEAFAEAISGVFVPLLDPEGPLIGELPGIVKRLIAPLLPQAIEFLDIEIREFVAQTDFRPAWAGLNRAAHSEWVGLVTGEGGESRVLVADPDSLAIRLDSLSLAIQERLVDRGLGVAERIPFEDVGGEVVLMRSSWVGRTLTLLRASLWLAFLLPALAAALLVTGFLLSPSRIHGVIVLGVAMSIAGIATLAYAGWVQDAIVQAAAAFGLGAAATDLIVSAVAESLRTWLRWMTGAGFAAVAGAVLVWLGRRTSENRQAPGTAPDSA